MRSPRRATEQRGSCASGERYVSRCEVFADGQKGLIGKLRDSVREAVTEIEVCAVAAASEPTIGGERLAPVNKSREIGGLTPKNRVSG